MAKSKMVLSEYRNYELPPEFPILALDGEEWRISPIRSANLHFHNCVEIGICRSGSGQMTLNQQDTDFQEGDVTLLGAQVHHTTWSAPDTFSLWSYLFVDPEKLLGDHLRHRAALRRLSAEGCLVLHPADAPWAGQLVKAILEEMREQQEGYRDCVRGLLLALLSRMVRLQSLDTTLRPESPVLAPALIWIRENYASEFPMEALADRCHLSPTHFRRLFREQMGTTPLDYLHQVRISASCSLLLSSGDSVAAVASQVGYASLSCFNRHFLRIMGVVPSKWRKTEAQLPRRSVLTFTGWTRAETTEEILQKSLRRSESGSAGGWY